MLYILHWDFIVSTYFGARAHISLYFSSQYFTVNSSSFIKAKYRYTYILIYIYTHIHA